MNQATYSFHHAQPKAGSAPLITPSDFYRKLLSHDWYYAWSDDGSAYRAGQAAATHLELLAKNSGAVHQWLLSEVSKHFYTGEPWGTARHPLPAPPTVLKARDAMTVRIELVKAEITKKAIDLFAAFLPAKFKAHDPVKPVLEKVYLGGFYAGNTQPPVLIRRHAKLRKAWDDGQSVVSEIAK